MNKDNKWEELLTLKQKIQTKEEYIKKLSKENRLLSATIKSEAQILKGLLVSLIERIK
jgi:hypothetical protein